MTYAETKRTPLECMCRGQQEQCEWGGCCGTVRPRTPCQMCGNERHEHERRLQLIGDGEGLEPDENGRMRLVIRRADFMVDSVGLNAIGCTTEHYRPITSN